MILKDMAELSPDVDRIRVTDGQMADRALPQI